MTVERLRRFLQGHYAGVEEEAAQGHRYAKAYFAALHFGEGIHANLLPGVSGIHRR